MDTFLSAPTCRMWNTRLMQSDSQIQIVAIAIRLTVFGAHSNLIHFQSEDRCTHHVVI